jgi:hypothetical protein
MCFPDADGSTPTGVSGLVEAGCCEPVPVESVCCTVFSWAREEPGAQTIKPTAANNSAPRPRTFAVPFIAAPGASAFSSFSERV